MEIVIAMENWAAGWRYFVSHSTAHGIYKTSLSPYICCFEEMLKCFPSCCSVNGGKDTEGEVASRERCC